MLLPAHPFILWCVAAGAVLYGVTWAAVMLANVRADRERSWSERILGLATEAVHDVRHEHDALALFLKGAPLSASLRILHSSTSLVIREVVARGLVGRTGRAALRREPRWWHLSNRRWRRIAALQVLVLGDRGASWDLLEAAVVDSDPAVAAAAVTLAGQIPDRKAAGILVSALRSGRYARSQIAAALDLFPMNVEDLVAPLLDEELSALRYWGTVLMRRYPRHAALAIRLHALVRDVDPLVRKAAIDAAAVVGDPDGLVAARQGLDDAVPFVRAHAALAVAAMRRPATATSIASLLADSDWGVRAAAKQSLVRLGSMPADAVLPFLCHPDEFARNAAAEVLQDVGQFERLLLLEVEGASDPARRDTLRLMASAGGADMRKAILDRLRPDARSSGEAVLVGLAVADTA